MTGGVWSERDIWQVVIHTQTDNFVSMKHVFTANGMKVFNATGHHEWQRCLTLDKDSFVIYI